MNIELDNIEKVRRKNKCDSASFSIEHMKKVRIKEVGSTLTGFAFNSQKFNGEKGFPIIRIRDLKQGLTKTFFDGEFDERYVVRKGDLLIGMDGEFNLAEWESNDALLNQRVCKLIIDESKTNKTYIKYALPKKLKGIEDVTPFVTVKHLSNKQVLEIEIPLPDLIIQQEIANMLEQADKARQQRKVANALTDQFLQSSFLLLFGDPVKNDKRWDVKKLEELGVWQSGGTPSRQVPKYFEGDIPWYSSGELNEMFVSDSYECITTEAIENSSTKLLEPNTLLLGMYDTAALKSSITTKPSSCNQAIAASKLEYRKADIFYVYHAIQYGKTHFRSQQRGVRQKNLNLTMIREIKLPIPPLSLQKQFADIVAQAEQLRQKQRESERELESLFQSLLQKYFEDQL